MNDNVVQMPQRLPRLVSKTEPRALLVELLRRIDAGELDLKGLAVIVIEPSPTDDDPERQSADAYYAGEPMGKIVQVVGWLEWVKAATIQRAQERHE